MISFISNFAFHYEESFHKGEDSLPKALQEALQETIDKTKKAATSLKNMVQLVVGCAAGTQLYRVYSPLTDRALKLLTPVTTSVPKNSPASGFLNLGKVLSRTDPFRGMSFGKQLFMAPMICILGPVLEELLFRGDLQGILKESLQPFYEKMGIQESQAKLAARVTAIFFSSLIFGLVHFTNAIVFGCSPMLFLPQVISATIMGVAFGMAKEMTGGLALPIGLHIGNNTLASLSFMGFV